MSNDLTEFCSERVSLTIRSARYTWMYFRDFLLYSFTSIQRLMLEFSSRQALLIDSY